MKYARLLVIAALVSVIGASSFAYVQFNARGADICAQLNAQLGCPFFFVPKFTYTVKFLCVPQDVPPKFAGEIGLEDGFYQTDINIHNPSFSTTDASIVNKFTLATFRMFVPSPGIQTYTAIPTPNVLRNAILKPDAALQFDCLEIMHLLFPDLRGPLVNCHVEDGKRFCLAKGFVIVYSDTDTLDVWAEYTTKGKGTDSPALEIVKILPAPFIP